MIEDSTTRDVYDLIAEFAKASNPSITDTEIQQQFPAPKTEEPISMEAPLSPSLESEVAESTTQKSTSQLNELNTKFEGLAEQLKETRKQIKKIKQAFTTTASQSNSFSTEYYHREFQMLSSRLNEVFVSNYKQIEDKFEALQRELARNRQTKDSASPIEVHPMSESFRLQHNMIVGLKEKIEKIHSTFQEKTSPKEHYLTKEEFHEELRRLTARQQERTHDEIKRSEQNILDTLRNLNQKETSHTQPQWLTWINLFILGLMVMYLLMQFVSPSNRRQAFEAPKQQPIQEEAKIETIETPAPHDSLMADHEITPSKATWFEESVSENDQATTATSQKPTQKIVQSTSPIRTENSSNSKKEQAIQKIKTLPLNQPALQLDKKDSTPKASQALVKEEVYFAED